MLRTFIDPRRAVLLFAAPLLAVILVSACSDDDEPTEPTSRVAMGQTNPENAPGQTLYLERVTIEPGAQLPKHYHEGTQIGYIEAGVLTYVIESGTANVVRADGTEETFGGPITIELHEGDHIIETADLIHYGGNDGDDQVVILLSVLLREGAPLSTPAE